MLKEKEKRRNPKVNDKETITQLSEIKKKLINSNNVSPKDSLAIENSIRAVKRYHNSNNSFWAGFIVCAIVAAVYLLIFSTVH
jgi:hypothetical protein